MSIPTVPPPIYSQENETSRGVSGDDAVLPSEAQLLISPSGNASQFQKGYLGVNGERAAIEGELQIKGVPVDSWIRLTVSLRSNESSDDRQIDLNSVDIVLYSRDSPADSTLPNSLTVASSIPFSIPLTADTPQCFHVGRSSLSHTLNATLQTSNPNLPLLTRSINVHTRRFTSHLLSCDISPRTVSLNNPTTVEVQVPRTMYRLGEAIPVYVTVPPPDRSVVLDHGFTLRSVRAELIRTVKVFSSNDGSEDESDSSDDEADISGEESSASSGGLPPSAEFLSAASEKGSSSNNGSLPPLAFAHRAGLESPFETIIARSGSSCRFHTSRPVKLKLVLHGNPQASPLNSNSRPLGAEDGFEEESQCAMISQTTLLHAIEFRVQVRVTFMHASTHSEQTYPLIIPITILPRPATLPEVDESIDSAYMKKHDRPPLKTVRREDSDVYIDDYESNHAGPSALPNGAPPPFDEAPPPPFSLGESSTSSRPPTFFESEAEIIVPSNDHPAVAAIPEPSHHDASMAGEGVLFGFPASEQYDGYSSEIERSSSPPPSLEMAIDDADVTDLVDFVNEPERAIDALNMVLEQQEETSNGVDGDIPPPPPPPLDDPLDPPPSIDTDFRSRSLSHPPPPSIHSTDFTSPGLTRVISNRPSVPQLSDPSPALNISGSHMETDEVPTISPSHAPPPYLNPVNLGDVEHVAGPPPYVDLLPSSQSHDQSR